MPLFKKEIPANDAEKIEASVASEASKLYASKKLAKLFEVDVTIRLFGQVVYTWHFPPKN